MLSLKPEVVIAQMAAIKPVPHDCSDIMNFGSTASGVYTTNLEGDVEKFLTAGCDMKTTSGEWLGNTLCSSC